MGSVSHIDEQYKEMVEVLEKALKDVSEGEVDGIVLFVEYKDETITSDWPGRFHRTNIVSPLCIAQHHFSGLALNGDYSEVEDE